MEQRRGLYYLGGLISLLVMGASLLLSFRVPISSLSLAYTANAAQFFALAAAGVAFSVFGSRCSAARELKHHVFGYSMVTAGLVGFLAPMYFEVPLAVSILCGLLAACFAAFLAKQAWRETAYANLILAVSLLLTFGLSVVAFGFASIAPDPFKVIALWLQGDLSGAHSSSAVLLVITLGVAFLAARSSNSARSDSSTPSQASKNTWLILLLGLGLGIAGPLFFVAWLAPTLAHRIEGNFESPRSVLWSVLIGTTALCFIDAGAAWLVGGYAPPAGISVAALAIPFALILNMARLNANSTRPVLTKVEIFIVVAGVAVLVLALVAAALFAHSAA